MSLENFEEWQRNLSKKIEDVQAAIFTFVSSDPRASFPHLVQHRELQYRSAKKEVANLSAMYGSGNRPTEVQKLDSELDYLHSNRNEPCSLPDVLKALNAVKNIPKTGMSFISFHDIYEKYREEGDLNELVDQLVTTLEKIIADDDGRLSSRIEKDIGKLLNQIRNRPKLSTYEIGAWAELTGKFLLGIVGQLQDVPCLPLILDAAKLSKKIFDNVFEKYQQSQSEYVRLIDLKSVPDSFSSLPPLSDAAIKAAEIEISQPGSAMLLSDSKTPRPRKSKPAAVPPSE